MYKVYLNKAVTVLWPSNFFLIMNQEVLLSKAQLQKYHKSYFKIMILKNVE